MSPDRFHLVLTVSLAGIIGFGAAHLLSSGDAEAYPSGAAVSYGSNPVFSFGDQLIIGRYTGTPTSAAVFTAPTTHDAVITDVIITVAAHGAAGAECNTSGTLEFSDGTSTLAEFSVVHPAWATLVPPSHIVATMESGILLAAGSTLTATVTTGYWYDAKCWGNNPTVSFTLAGYHAEP